MNLWFMHRHATTGMDAMIVMLVAVVVIVATDVRMSISAGLRLEWRHDFS